jgi:hypothetical protein
MLRIWTCTVCGRTTPTEIPGCYLIRGRLTCIWCLDIDALPDLWTRVRMLRRRAEATRQKLAADRALRQQKAPPALPDGAEVPRLDMLG